MLYKNFGNLRNILLATSIETMSFHSCSLALCKSCVLFSKPIPSVWATTKTVCKAILNPYSCLQLPADPIFRTSEGLSCLVTAFSYSGLPKQPCWQKSRVLYILLSTAILTTQMSSLIAPWNYNCTPGKFRYSLPLMVVLVSAPESGMHWDI